MESEQQAIMGVCLSLRTIPRTRFIHPHIELSHRMRVHALSAALRSYNATDCVVSCYETLYLPRKVTERNRRSQKLLALCLRDIQMHTLVLRFHGHTHRRSK